MMWGWGYGSWWMGVFMILFWAGVIALIVWAVLSATRGSVKSGRRAIEVLEERFARGEIDLDEFEQRRSALERG